MCAIKISNEQEAYVVMKSLYAESHEIYILSLLAYLETLSAVDSDTNYFDLNRDLIVHDLGSNFSTKKIISIIKNSSQEHFEPKDQSVKKGSVFFLKKNIDPYLDIFIDEVLII